MEVHIGGFCFLECNCSTSETLEMQIGDHRSPFLTWNTWYLFKKAFLC